MPEQPELVDVSFSVSFETGKLQTTFPVPSGQTTLTQLLPILHSFSSGIAEHVGKVAAQHGTPVNCGPKCSACCYQLVPISPFEAEALANWIRSLPPQQQQSIMARFRQALLGLQEKGVLAKLTPEMFSFTKEQSKELNGDYFSAGVACPFLFEDNCSIHPMRPTVCREYTVVTPPEYCSEPRHERAQVVVLPVKVSKALQVLGRRVESDPHGWLPLVFLFHWMTTGSKPGESVTGTGPELVREFLLGLSPRENNNPV